MVWIMLDDGSYLNSQSIGILRIVRQNDLFVLQAILSADLKYYNITDSIFYNPMNLESSKVRENVENTLHKLLLQLKVGS